MLSVYDNRLDDVQYNMNIYFFEPALGEKKRVQEIIFHIQLSLSIGIFQVQ